MPQPKQTPFSSQSHGAALAWEWHLSADGLLGIKSHSLATRGVAVVCLDYVFAPSLKISQHLLNLVSKFEYKEN